LDYRNYRYRIMKHLKTFEDLEIPDLGEVYSDDEEYETVCELGSDGFLTNNEKIITVDERDELSKIALVRYIFDIDSGFEAWTYKEKDSDEIDEWLEEYRLPENKEARKFGL